MIEIIFNGYYRSGSTLVWKLLKNIFKQQLFLYEPHSESVHCLLKTGKAKRETIEPLHQLPIFSDYFDLPQSIFNDYIKNGNPRMIYNKENIEDAFYILDLFYKVNIPVWIKSNQLHFILPEVKQKYNCKIVGIKRNIAGVILSHLGMERKRKPEMEKALLKGDYSIIEEWVKKNCFGLGLIKYTFVKEGLLTGKENLLAMMTKIIKTCNELNEKEADFVFDYELLMENPELQIGKFINNIFGIEIDKTRNYKYSLEFEELCNNL